MKCLHSFRVRNRACFYAKMALLVTFFSLSAFFGCDEGPSAPERKTGNHQTINFFGYWKREVRSVDNHQIFLFYISPDNSYEFGSTRNDQLDIEETGNWRIEGESVIFVPSLCKESGILDPSLQEVECHTPDTVSISVSDTVWTLPAPPLGVMQYTKQ